MKWEIERAPSPGAADKAQASQQNECVPEGAPPRSVAPWQSIVGVGVAVTRVSDWRRESFGHESRIDAPWVEDARPNNSVAST